MFADTSPLVELGWSSHWQALFAPHDSGDLIPGRVIRSDRGSSLIAVPGGIVRAKPSTRLLKTSRGAADLPVAGDWVGASSSEDIDVPPIDVVLDRRSAITRRNPGDTSAIQVLAANVDTVFVIHPIAGQPNLRRIERELALAWDSGAVPVVVLTKADQSLDLGASLAEVRSIAFGVAAVSLSRSLTDFANLSAFIWKEGGGYVPPPQPTPYGHSGPTVTIAALDGGFPEREKPASGSPAMPKNSLVLPPP